MARVPALALVSPAPDAAVMRAEALLARLIGSAHHSWCYSTNCCASCQWLSLLGVYEKVVGVKQLAGTNLFRVAHQQGMVSETGDNTKSAKIW
jgi:hypothetical protein